MDETLRQLEQRWRTTNAIEDEAAFLAARVQGGNLSGESLALAACCYDPAAVATESEIPQEFEPWVERVEGALRAGPTGAEELARVAFVRSFLGRVSQSAEAGRIASLADALEEWALCPCRRHKRDYVSLRERAHYEVSHQGSSLKPVSVLWRLAGWGISWTELLALGTAEELREALRAGLVPWRVN